MDSYVILYHHCYRSTGDAGYRMYTLDSRQEEYMADNPSMYELVAYCDDEETAHEIVDALETVHALSQE